MAEELLGQNTAENMAENMTDVGMENLAAELGDNFIQVYTKFKIHFYQELFGVIQERETSLSTVEVFCVEMIHALNNPSVNEFANFINISAPNAAYKVNSLIKKGYIDKVQSTEDKREYHLRVTDKYYRYYNLSTSYGAQVVRRICRRFGVEQLKFINEVLQVMNEELMPELPTLNTKGKKPE